MSHPLKILIWAALTASVMMSATATADAGKRQSFYERRAEGWFWHEPDPEPPVKKEPTEPDITPVIVTPSPAEPAPETSEPDTQELEPMTVEWFKVNLPKARDMAINNPSQQNVRRYLYLQRAAMDRSTEFMTTYITTQMFDPYLDEGLRRPEIGASMKTNRIEQDKGKWRLFKELASENSLVYFYSSDCSYCAQQTPFLARIVEEHGWNVLPVSLDGGPVPNDPDGIFSDYKTATQEMAERFEVVITPTIYLSNTRTQSFYLLSQGLLPLAQFAERTILLARAEKLITNEQYNQTAQVKDYLMTDARNGQELVDTDRVYEDPDYLIDIMRNKLTGGAYKASGAPKGKGE